MSSTAGRDLVRTVVLATNPYWPFTHCNRWPYAGALRLFVRALRNTTEIRSIYLRRIPPQREWIPGLSDIDLTLVLEGGLSADREFQVLESVWKIHDRLERVFPMIGELEILDEDELSAWLAWTISSPQGASWRLLHGHLNPHVLSAEPADWRRRAIAFALWIYVDLLPPCLLTPGSSLRRHDILRRIRKILRTLEPILVEAGHKDLSTERPSVSPASLMADALKAVEVAIAHATATHSRAASDAAVGKTLTLRRTGQEILVIGDGLDRDVITQRVESIQPAGPGTAEVPLVLTHSVLAYLVRQYNPHDYSNIATEWAVSDGSRPLADIPPPGWEEFAAYAMDRIASLVIFARSDEVLAKPLSLPLLRKELDRALDAVVLLRTRGTPWHGNEGATRRSVVECPQYTETFEEIQALLGDSRAQEARRKAFDLFRSISRDARDLMAGAEHP